MAQRVFTAEFGMGSGVWPLAMATRPAKRPSGGRGDVGRKCLQARPLRVVGPPPVHALLMPGASLAGIGVLALGAGDGVGEFKPIERLVPVSCAGCPASTSGLSTWWSSTALKETWF